MTEGPRIDPLRLTEAAGEAAAVLALVALPVAGPALDTRLTAVLTGMLVLLTGGVYALHAVTFDSFRMTGHRQKDHFRSPTVRNEPSAPRASYPRATNRRLSWGRRCSD